MLKPLKSILFATDLTKNCQPALDYTLSMATRFNATIHMLHVIEKLPENVDDKLKDLLGTHQWEDMLNSHRMYAHKTLLGKQSTNAVVREAIHNFCMQEGIDIESHDVKYHEIIITDGDVIDDIMTNAAKNSCDLIVIGGSHGGLFSQTALTNTAKGLLKRTAIPVTVVPAKAE